jgi:hypothetical protein
MIATPSPIGVQFLVLATAAALFDMKVFLVVVRIDGLSTAVAPNHGLMCGLDFNIERHEFTKPSNTVSTLISI